MLKFFFWSLLLLNAGLLSYQRGYLAAWMPDGHEPERLARQLNPESMKPVSAAVAEAPQPAGVTAPAAIASVVATANVRPEVPVCIELGTFDSVGSRRFESQLQPLSLGEKMLRHEVDEVARNIVYIPSQGSKEGADKKAAELRHLGVTDFYIIQDTGEFHWGISLGVFKTEDSARAQLTALNQKGVHSARLGTHNVNATKMTYQLRNLDVASKASLDKILLGFPHIERRSCTQTTVAVAVAKNVESADKENKESRENNQEKEKEVLPREATH